MKKIKLISIILALVLVVSCFAACGNKTNNDPTDPANVTDNANPVEKNDKVLVMGTNAAFPPYEFVDDDGNFAGIDVDIATAVAEKIGMTLEVKDMEFKTLITAVQEGSVDVVLAGLTVDPERAEKVNFSTSYAKGVQVIIVPDGSDIKTVDDLKGKKIGVQSGTTGDIYCTGEFTEDFVNQYDNGALAVQALKNGQVDCVVIDNEPAKSFVAVNEGLSILATSYADEDYAAAFAKEDTELLEKFDAALKELQADGTIDEIIAKYIKAE